MKNSYAFASNTVLLKLSICSIWTKVMNNPVMELLIALLLKKLSEVTNQWKVVTSTDEPCLTLHINLMPWWSKLMWHAAVLKWNVVWQQKTMMVWITVACAGNATFGKIFLPTIKSLKLTTLIQETIICLSIVTILPLVIWLLISCCHFIKRRLCSCVSSDGHVMCFQVIMWNYSSGISMCLWQSLPGVLYLLCFFCLLTLWWPLPS